MKIFLPNWKAFGINDLTDTLETLGHHCVISTSEPSNYRNDSDYETKLSDKLKKEDFTLVFSFNYYPIISKVCNELHLPYIAWCYDSPLILTYSKTITNSCNHIFLFDSSMVEELKTLGATQVYYMPMAINTERIDKLQVNQRQKKIISADISFVGRMYTEKHNLYDRMTGLDEHTKGYLEGIMNAQRLVYGYSFIESLLTPEIIDKLQKALPLQVNEDGLETLSYTYANYVLCRKMTAQDRLEYLYTLSQMLSKMSVNGERPPYPLKLYTSEATPLLPDIQNMGEVHYYKEMPLVFRHSKINLNISLRSIKTGIPLRAMDIMGAGGFLLTNYQSDFNLHFIDGEDYVSYDSLQDLVNKTAFYLNHETERKRIAKNGYHKVKNNHNYKITVEKILQTVR